MSYPITYNQFTQVDGRTFTRTTPPQSNAWGIQCYGYNSDGSYKQIVNTQRITIIGSVSYYYIPDGDGYTVVKTTNTITPIGPTKGAVGSSQGNISISNNVLTVTNPIQNNDIITVTINYITIPIKVGLTTGGFSASTIVTLSNKTFSMAGFPGGNYTIYNGANGFSLASFTFINPSITSVTQYGLIMKVVGTSLYEGTVVVNKDSKTGTRVNESKSFIVNTGSTVYGEFLMDSLTISSTGSNYYSAFTINSSLVYSSSHTYTKAVTPGTITATQTANSLTITCNGTGLYSGTVSVYNGTTPVTGAQNIPFTLTTGTNFTTTSAYSGISSNCIGSFSMPNTIPGAQYTLNFSMGGFTPSTSLTYTAPSITAVQYGNNVICTGTNLLSGTVNVYSDSSFLVLERTNLTFVLDPLSSTRGMFTLSSGLVKKTYYLVFTMNPYSINTTLEYDIPPVLTISSSQNGLLVTCTETTNKNLYTGTLNVFNTVTNTTQATNVAFNSSGNTGTFIMPENVGTLNQPNTVNLNFNIGGGLMPVSVLSYTKPSNPGTIALMQNGQIITATCSGTNMYQGTVSIQSSTGVPLALVEASNIPFAYTSGNKGTFIMPSSITSDPNYKVVFSIGGFTVNTTLNYTKPSDPGTISLTHYGRIITATCTGTNMYQGTVSIQLSSGAPLTSTESTNISQSSNITFTYTSGNKGTFLMPESINSKSDYRVSFSIGGFTVNATLNYVKPSNPGTISLTQYGRIITATCTGPNMYEGTVNVRLSNGASLTSTESTNISQSSNITFTYTSGNTGTFIIPESINSKIDYRVEFSIGGFTVNASLNYLKSSDPGTISLSHYGLIVTATCTGPNMYIGTVTISGMSTTYPNISFSYTSGKTGTFLMPSSISSANYTVSFSIGGWNKTAALNYVVPPVATMTSASQDGCVILGVGENLYDGSVGVYTDAAFTLKEIIQDLTFTRTSNTTGSFLLPESTGSKTYYLKFSLGGYTTSTTLSYTKPVVPVLGKITKTPLGFSQEADPNYNGTVDMVILNAGVASNPISTAISPTTNYVTFEIRPVYESNKSQVRFTYTMGGLSPQVVYSPRVSSITQNGLIVTATGESLNTGSITVLSNSGEERLPLTLFDSTSSTTGTFKMLPDIGTNTTVGIYYSFNFLINGFLYSAQFPYTKPAAPGIIGTSQNGFEITCTGNLYTGTVDVSGVASGLPFSQGKFVMPSSALSNPAYALTFNMGGFTSTSTLAFYVPEITTVTQNGLIITCTGTTLGNGTVSVDGITLPFVVSSPTKGSFTLPESVVDGEYSLHFSISVFSPTATLTYVFPIPSVVVSASTLGSLVTCTGTNLYSGTVTILEGMVERHSGIVFDRLSETTGSFVMPRTIESNTYTLRFLLGGRSCDMEYAYVKSPDTTLNQPVQSGVIITSTGTNFYPGTVTLVGESYPPLAFDTEKGTFLMPIQAPSKTYTLQYTLSGFTFDYSLTYTKLPAPSFNTPTHVLQEVTCTGTNLYSGMVNISSMVNISDNVSFTTDATISNRGTFTMPTTIHAGVYSLQFSTAGFTSTAQMSYTNASLTEFSPVRGVQKSKIVLSGVNFSQITRIEIGNTRTNFSYDTTSITVTVPDSEEETAIIRIFDVYENQLSYDSPFTYTNLAATVIEPLSGCQRSSTTLSGLNFSNLDYIEFGNASTRVFTYTENNISVEVPVSNQTTGIVKVFDTYGNSVTYSRPFTYKNLTTTTFKHLADCQKSNLQLSGSNFSRIDFIAFGNTSTQDFTYTSNNISVEIPDSDQTTCPIVIHDNYGNTKEYATLFTYANLSVSTYSPLIAPALGTIQLSGSNFSKLDYITFGNTSTLDFTYTANNISVIVPESIQGQTVPISVYNIYGDSTVYSTLFTYMTVTTFEPGYTSQRRTLQLSGDNFSALDYISFGNTSTRDFTYTSNNISVKVPDSDQYQADIILHDVHGNSVKYLDPFTYTNPQIVSLEDLENPQYSTTYIYGSNLQNTSFVKFGNEVTFPIEITDSMLYVNIPKGDGNVSVIAYDDLLNETMAASFTYKNVSAHLVTPSYGTKNWNVTITGDSLSYATRLYVGGQEITKGIQTNDFINFTVPEGQGNVSIYLEDNYGNSTMLNTFEYKNPEVTRFNVSTGRTNQLRTVHGKNLDNMSYIMFGEKRNKGVLELRNMSVNVITPDHIGEVSVTLVDIFENEYPCPGTFTCLGGNASVFKIEPNRGTHNTSVTIGGENLGFTSDVLFKSANASINGLSYGFVNISAPLGESSVNVKVLDIESDSIFYYGTFDYENPVITSMVPSEGPNRIPTKLLGDFLGDTQTLYFGNTSIPFEKEEDGLKFVVPDGSMNTSIHVVDHLGNRSDCPSQFIYKNPVISSITPSKGPQRSQVEILGQNLQNSSTLVFYNSMYNMSYNTSILTCTTNSVTAKVPDGTGEVSVILTDEYMNTVTTQFTYQYPNVSQQTPGFGPKNSSVDMYGRYLENISYVLFDNVSAMVEVRSSTHVQVRVPTNLRPTNPVNVVAYDRYMNMVPLSDYTYKNPTAVSLNPSGFIHEPVFLEGDNLEHTTRIMFGEFEATQFSHANGSIRIKVPPGSGNVSVTAYDKYNNAAKIEQFEYLNFFARSMPSVGFINHPILIEGDNLDNTSSVWFGPEKANFSYANGSIRLLIPEGKGIVPVNLYDRFDNTTGFESFEYLTKTIQSIFPRVGTQNQWIKIRGGLLENTSYVGFANTTPGNFQTVYTREFHYANGSMLVKVPPRNDGLAIPTYSVQISIYDAYDSPTLYTGSIDLTRL